MDLHDFDVLHEVYDHLLFSGDLNDAHLYFYEHYLGAHDRDHPYDCYQVFLDVCDPEDEYESLCVSVWKVKLDHLESTFQQTILILKFF